MEWKNLDSCWKMAFNNAWEAFKINTIPISCIIMDENNSVVASGKNTVYCKDSKDMKLFNSKLAHAEINTILLLDESLHPNIKKYTLYTTMEPCILCFGAIIMGNIRNVKFAAKDRFAGATQINKSLEYIKSKKINIEGPIDYLEYVQICLQSYYELMNNNTKSEKILIEWEKDCRKGIKIAKKLYENKLLEKYCKENRDMEYVYNEIMEKE
jgi:tRNA(Arg) A34 adenosine deaminase TadA